MHIRHQIIIFNLKCCSCYHIDTNIAKTGLVEFQTELKTWANFQLNVLKILNHWFLVVVVTAKFCLTIWGQVLISLCLCANLEADENCMQYILGLFIALRVCRKYTPIKIYFRTYQVHFNVLTILFGIWPPRALFLL